MVDLAPEPEPVPDPEPILDPDPVVVDPGPKPDDVAEENAVLAATVKMRTEGDNVWIPAESGDGEPIQVRITPAILAAIQGADLAKVPEVTTKTQYRVVIVDPDNPRRIQSTRWSDIQPEIQQRQVPTGG